MTRTEALDLATQWAKSAQSCYRRAARADDDARIADTGRPPTDHPSPNVRHLIRIAETEYRSSQIEAALATAWAAIAAAAPEDGPQLHIQVEEPQP
ncbi:hypothetical protein ACIRRH_41210 [Kitasatospora sp. NPDC101235]|uniref:hypothetical protein n=1 Tax=Kitasatospora sp. NPDC101235 TaxID=3364101 RepID=UPI00380565DE